MIDTSNQLKALRKERKLTIQAVCEGTGIAIRTYQNYEYGKREISAEALYKLADFYGVTTDFILGREEPPNPFAKFIREPMDWDEFEKTLEKLPEFERSIMYTFLHMMAERNKAAHAPTTNGELRKARSDENAENQETG